MKSTIRAMELPFLPARIPLPAPFSFTKSMRHLREKLFEPVDVASLACFRIAFGAIMAWEAWDYFKTGWLKAHYIDPTFHFTYYGFDWVKPWPGNGMYLHFCALGVLALCILLGLFYRVAAVLFFLGFAYVFLLEKTLYLNHFYLIVLISLLLIFIPAHRAFSIDALRHKTLHADTVPGWTLWILRAQIGIVYFYGGIAKLNPDWLRGVPLQTVLPRQTDFPLLGPFMAEKWMPLFFSYGGLLLDLLITPLLLWPRTRPFAFGMVVLFHMMNSQLFFIGIFPWLMIAATLLFFRPDWPRRIRARWFKQPLSAGGASHPAAVRGRKVVTMAALGVYFALQLLLPLRHFLYPGDVNWTEEGHRFSWRMKLRYKEGVSTFFVTDLKSGTTWQVEQFDYLKGWQKVGLSIHPDMILQFSHYLAEEWRRKGYEQVEVRAKVFASLNGRKPQLLIDPTIDLAKIPRNLKPATYIIPLKEPLPN